jgi:hypothetical protein
MLCLHELEILAGEVLLDPCHFLPTHILSNRQLAPVDWARLIWDWAPVLPCLVTGCSDASGQLGSLQEMAVAGYGYGYGCGAWGGTGLHNPARRPLNYHPLPPIHPSFCYHRQHRNLVRLGRVRRWKGRLFVHGRVPRHPCLWSVAHGPTLPHGLEDGRGRARGRRRSKWKIVGGGDEGFGTVWGRLYGTAIVVIVDIVVDLVEVHEDKGRGPIGRLSREALVVHVDVWSSYERRRDSLACYHGALLHDELDPIHGRGADISNVATGLASTVSRSGDATGKTTEDLGSIWETTDRSAT